MIFFSSPPPITGDFPGTFPSEPAVNPTTEPSRLVVVVVVAVAVAAAATTTTTITFAKSIQTFVFLEIYLL